jgi:hypothetical protein
MPVMVAARTVLVRMPVVRSGSTGSGCSAVAAGLRSRVGWSFLIWRAEYRGGENQREYRNDLFHRIAPKNWCFLATVLKHTRRTECKLWQ